MWTEAPPLFDAGIARVDNKILGDVDLESVKSKVSLATPTPGGIGPITVMTLLWNVYLASMARQRPSAKR